MSVQCPECFSEVSSNAVKCLTCGFPISKSSIELKDLDLSPLMIVYQSPIARHNIVPPHAKLRPKFIEDKELAEDRDGLVCLECGGGITPDDIKCSHCKTLIMRRYCSHCSKLIPDHAAVCPLCSKDVKEHFSYSKLRRTKILISAGTAAIFLFVVVGLFLQKTASKTTVEADAINKPEIHLAETKPADSQAVQKEVKLPPEPPAVHEIVPPPTATKFEPPPQVRKPAVLAQKQVNSEVENADSEPPKLAKVQEPKLVAKVEEPIEVTKVEEPKQFVKAQDPPARPMLSPAFQRTPDLKSQQRVLKGRSLNHKGYSLIKAGRPSDAIPILQQAVRSFPESKRDLNYAYALFNLAVAYRMAGKPEMAIPLLQERIKINDQRDVVARELRSAQHAAARLAGASENEFN